MFLGSAEAEAPPEDSPGAPHLCRAHRLVLLAQLLFGAPAIAYLALKKDQPPLERAAAGLSAIAIAVSAAHALRDQCAPRDQ